MKKNNLIYIFFVCVLGALVAVIIILQIITLSDKTTKIEQSLFSILQFVFSLGFSWLLTKITSANEFYESQKRFALSAYRRIKEIDKAVERLIERTNNKSFSSGKTNELETIYLMAINIKETIRSSIADWTDIIGEEIEKVNAIEKKEEELELIQQNEISFSNDLLRVTEEINKLKATLPSELKLVTREQITFEEQVRENIKRLKNQLREEKNIEFSGLLDSTFDLNIDALNIGATYEVCIDDNVNRISIFVLKDENGKPVGMLTNNLGHTYESFVKAVVDTLRKSKFKVKITESINKDYSSNVHHFRAKLEQ